MLKKIFYDGIGKIYGWCNPVIEANFIGATKTIELDTDGFHVDTSIISVGKLQYSKELLDKMEQVKIDNQKINLQMRIDAMEKLGMIATTEINELERLKNG